MGQGMQDMKPRMNMQQASQFSHIPTPQSTPPPPFQTQYNDGNHDPPFFETKDRHRQSQLSQSITANNFEVRRSPDQYMQFPQPGLSHLPDHNGSSNFMQHYMQ
jgi:hypothetical protein